MKYNKKYSPGIAIWEITLKCNLKCLHCGSSAGDARVNELSTDEGLKLLKQLANLGFKGVTLFGGEPFLRRDWLIFSKEIKDLGMKLSVVSNGFVKARTIIADLVRLEADSIQIGLDGASERMHDKIRGINGSFEKAVEFMRLSKKAGLSIGAITTVSKLNFKELPAISDFLIKEAIDWQIQEAIPIGRCPVGIILSKQEYYSLGLFIASTRKKFSSKEISASGPHNLGFHSQLIPNLSFFVNWKGCRAGKTVLGLQSDGNVKGCLALSDEFIEGNIRDKSIIEIWNDPNSFRYNRKFTEDDLGENCKNCKYATNCKGGCLTRSTSLTGQPYNDPYCYYRIEQELVK